MDQDVRDLMRVMQGAQMLGADQIDHALAGTLVNIRAVVGPSILVPDGMSERHIEPVDGATVTIDELRNLRPIGDGL
jgi:hypothetical protein